jgi:N-(2-amino-2-carboxyethyl)-L-glutamate synthase
MSRNLATSPVTKIAPPRRRAALDLWPRLDRPGSARAAVEELSLDGLRQDVGRTPLGRIRVVIDGCERDVYLKLESANPFGSIKDRTAWSLVSSIGLERLLREEIVLVESTSGNVGIALAAIARLAGISFTAVVDPKTPPRILDEIASLGAKLDMVTTPDAAGGYLQSRLRRVDELCAEMPNAVWVDQYSNEANPLAHLLGTGPEIDVQTDGASDVLFVAVSTGGTLAGVARHFREQSPRTRIVAVDAVGSIVFSEEGGPRRLTGIGASRKSDFVREWHYDEVVLVPDALAFAFCRALHRDTRIAVGGSAGAVLAACCRWLSDHPEVRRPVCIVPDGGSRYRNTVYHDGWVGSEVLEHERELVASPNSGEPFRFEATTEVRPCP